ncbi:MAG: hypothetical protein MJZ58_00260 [Paludibacteraceae bacterium]|nr:hypothetical protein [Paludibacteraceae bacterium]
MKKLSTLLLICFAATLSAQNYPSSKIGILWSTWHPDHFKDYKTYISTMEQWGNSYVSMNPTYFLDTYEKGILTQWNNQDVTPSIDLQKEVLTELIKRGFYVNYRPHVDPIKFAMQEGSSERNNCSSDPGGKDWRGEFDKMDPTDKTIGYKEKVVLPGLKMVAEVIRDCKKNGITPVSPIRFDLGAELMDAMVNYPEHWIDLQQEVRNLLNNQYSDVKDQIVLGHNFCHHIEYLLRLPNHESYFGRIQADQKVEGHEKLLYLDRPGVTDDTRHAIGRYIAGLDEMSLSQYMPLDIYNTDHTQTTPDDVYRALLWHEQNFINECLIKECGIAKEDLPILHIGEYGMGWRGLNAPNVWDVDAWNRAGTGHLILSEAEQKADAAVAIDGIIKYVDESSPTNYRSFLLWFGGKPYDLLNINAYSNWYNEKGAASLKAYWASHKGMPDLSKPGDADFDVKGPDIYVPIIPTRRLLDDFEDYTSSSALQDAWRRNDGGAWVEASLDQTQAQQGTKCMKLYYDLSGNTYAGVMKGGSGSVSGFDGIAYTVIPDGSGADLLLQVQDDKGSYWKYTIQLTGTEPREVYMPFTDFVGGYNTSGKWSNPGGITELAFYVEKGSKGTIYIDDIRATYEQAKIDSIDSVNIANQEAATSAIEIAPTRPTVQKCMKMLYNNQIIILREGRFYGIDGRELY